MKIDRIVKAHIDSVKLGYWSEEDQDWHLIEEMTDEDVGEILKCSPELIDFIKMNFTDLLEQLKLDLTDIWEKVQ